MPTPDPQELSAESIPVRIDDQTVDVVAMARAALELPPEWRCNAVAVAAGKLERTYPDPPEIQDALERPDQMLVWIADDTFAIFHDARNSPRGGGYWKWQFIPSGGDKATRQRLWVALAMPAVVKYRHVWGRVTKKEDRDAMVEFQGCTVAEDDPEVLYFWGI